MGSAWYFFSKYSSDFSMNQMEGADENYVPESFYEQYVDEDEHSSYARMVIVTYFSFTTLSTIGYGDKRPHSDAERIVDSAIMLSGVVIFSFIMDSFTKIVFTLRKATRENGEPEMLI
jgi:hypothetical protein